VGGSRHIEKSNPNYVKIMSDKSREHKGIRTLSLVTACHPKKKQDYKRKKTEGAAPTSLSYHTKNTPRKKETLQKNSRNPSRRGRETSGRFGKKEGRMSATGENDQRGGRMAKQKAKRIPLKRRKVSAKPTATRKGPGKPPLPSEKKNLREKRTGISEESTNILWRSGVIVDGATGRSNIDPQTSS